MIKKKKKRETKREYTPEKIQILWFNFGDCVCPWSGRQQFRKNSKSVWKLEKIAKENAIGNDKIHHTFLHWTAKNTLVNQMVNHGIQYALFACIACKSCLTHKRKKKIPSEFRCNCSVNCVFNVHLYSMCTLHHRDHNRVFCAAERRQIRWFTEKDLIVVEADTWNLKWCCSLEAKEREKVLKMRKTLMNAVKKGEYILVLSTRWRYCKQCQFI